MRGETPGWAFGDAWFATALAVLDRPAALAEILAAADAINHAIPTEDEIVHAVQLLDGCGLLDLMHDGRLRLTASGRALLERRTGGLVGQTGSVERLLRKIPPTPSAARPSAQSLATAYAAYAADAVAAQGSNERPRRR